MLLIRVPDRDITIEDQAEAAKFLSGIGIEYERWETGRTPGDNASQEEVLSAYSEEVERLKTRAGYTTADVIDINSNTQGLEEMLERFRKEHWHSEDEVRFTLSGHGVFHIHPEGSDVVAIEVGEGDLIRVPQGTRHWFDLCSDRQIRAIRLFQDKSGWTPFYVEGGVDSKYTPMCFGPSYIRPGSQGH